MIYSNKGSRIDAKSEDFAFELTPYTDARKKAKKNGGDTLIERSYHTNIFKERNPQKTILIS